MSKKVDLYPDREYTFSSYVVAGDFIFTSHQGGAHGKDFVTQLEASFQSLKETLKAEGATLDDVVKITMLIKDKSDFPKCKDVYRRVFKNSFPARTTIITDFVSEDILVQIDAIAYKRDRRMNRRKTDRQNVG